MIFKKMAFQQVEQMVFFEDQDVGLKAIVALHSCLLGPALGGCRIWNYASEEDAIEDAVRLARGMTYKAALAGLPLGGGKAVIWKHPHFPVEGSAQWRALLERFGECVNRFHGAYLTAKDVGMSSESLKVIKTKTPYVYGIQGEAGSSGDPSPVTARGIYHGMRAAAHFALGSDSLKGLTIALQGLGSVSTCLLEYLMTEGAHVVACDINPEAIERVQKQYSVSIVGPDDIYDVACDVFSPSALGGTINAMTIPRIRAKVIAGAANNQLANPLLDGELLLKHNMVYAPDYAINAGGLINIYYESSTQWNNAKDHDSELPYNELLALKHVDHIGETISTILKRSQKENIPSHEIADLMVLERLKNASTARSI